MDFRVLKNSLYAKKRRLVSNVMAWSSMPAVIDKFARIFNTSTCLWSALVFWSVRYDWRSMNCPKGSRSRCAYTCFFEKQTENSVLQEQMILGSLVYKSNIHFVETPPHWQIFIPIEFQVQNNKISEDVFIFLKKCWIKPPKIEHIVPKKVN